MTSSMPHPSSAIDQNIAATLRKLASEAEQKQVLHPDQVNCIMKEKWFKMFVPASLGGLALSLPQALRIEESISYGDGSTGWVVTLCAGAGWFVGFVSSEIARALFAPDAMCIAGSGALSGTAEKTNDGYILTGLWPFASGALHATAFTVNAVVTENNKPLFNRAGSRDVITLILPRTQVDIRKTWNAMGMIATGSHSFGANQVFVPNSQAFHIDAQSAVMSDPIYQYPFTQFAEATLAVNVSGMAYRFIDLLTEETRRDNKSNITTQVQSLKDQLNGSRAMLFQSVQRSWEMTERGQMSKVLANDVSRTSQLLVQVCRSCVNTLYPFTGLQGTFMDREINRVWRNIQTATQHAILNRL